MNVEPADCTCCRTESYCEGKV